MKFCAACSNMLYGIDEKEIDGKKVAVLSCIKCDYVEPIGADNPVVYEHILKKGTAVSMSMNPYLKHDPTLIHLDNVKCRNDDCSSRSGKKWDVVAIKTDDVKLVWMYQCANCSETWEQSSRAYSNGEA
jgi:DNA-directed RNA polymerase subunit M/transcription elongation factor TFIIS